MNKLAQMRQKRRTESGTAGMSTTSNAELLFIEAELAAGGRAENYHIPSDESVLGEIQARCKQHDIEPAWVVVDGVE